jgi:THO complex subunit 5
MWFNDSGISTSVENSRLEDDAPDEEDDGQRRRKRPKRVPSKESLDQDGVYQVHPLKIILHIYDDGVSDPKSAKVITLKFEFMLKLNVVCVGIEGSHDGAENNILCNLFPDDTGIELPHQVWTLVGHCHLSICSLYIFFFFFFPLIFPVTFSIFFVMTILLDDVAVSQALCW